MNLLRKIVTYLFPTSGATKSRTVRYAFPFMFAALAFLGGQAITSQNNTYISVESSTNSLKAGDSFHFNVYVHAAAEINAVNLEISFPEDQVKITGIDTGESVITLWTEDPYVEGNIVNLRGGTFRRGFIGTHLIATINAKALKTGIADIKIEDKLLLAGDGAGTKVFVEDNEEEQAKVYIANEDGTFATGQNTGSEFSANVEVKIVTDIDGDGDVSLADLSRFMSAWASGKVVYDFNGDGRMTFRDFSIILSDSFFK